MKRHPQTVSLDLPEDLTSIDAVVTASRQVGAELVFQRTAALADTHLARWITSQHGREVTIATPSAGELTVIAVALVGAYDRALRMVIAEVDSMLEGLNEAHRLPLQALKITLLERQMVPQLQAAWKQEAE